MRPSTLHIFHKHDTKQFLLLAGNYLIGPEKLNAAGTQFHSHSHSRHVPTPERDLFRTLSMRRPETDVSYPVPTVTCCPYHVRFNCTGRGRLKRYMEI